MTQQKGPVLKETPQGAGRAERRVSVPVNVMMRQTCLLSVRTIRTVLFACQFLWWCNMLLYAVLRWIMLYCICLFLCLVCIFICNTLFIPSYLLSLSILLYLLLPLVLPLRCSSLTPLLPSLPPFLYPFYTYTLHPTPLKPYRNVRHITQTSHSPYCTYRHPIARTFTRRFTKRRGRRS